MHFSLGEITFLLVLALVLVGPRKMPEIARLLGKYIGEFRRASNEFRRQLETEMLNIELEERAKKRQENITGEPAPVPVSPAENATNAAPHQPLELVARPVTEAVSRTPTAPAVMTAAEPDLSAHPSQEPSRSAGAR